MKNRVELGELERAFIDSVNSAGFPWMGVVRARDRLGIPHLIYYLEDPSLINPQLSHSGSADIVKPFTSLSLAGRPEIIIDLYYSYPTDTSPERITSCLSDARIRYGDETARLIWTTSFFPVNK